MIRQAVKQVMRQISPEVEEISDAIWDYAELGFQEIKSAKKQADYLMRAGFNITMPFAGMKTAMMAERGSGRPVIAFLGEMDALPGLSQRAGCAQKNPVLEGAPGHGCGHNLLGAGALEAAVATAEYLSIKGLKGTVRYYACPAEGNWRGKSVYGFG